MYNPWGEVIVRGKESSKSERVLTSQFWAIDNAAWNRAETRWEEKGVCLGQSDGIWADDENHLRYIFRPLKPEHQTEWQSLILFHVFQWLQISKLMFSNISQVSFCLF